MVDEQDYADAKRIIQAWDAKQPVIEEQHPVKKKISLGAVLVGFICGMASMIFYFNTPVTEEGVDYNGDGSLDEKWIFVNDRISKAETDRNFDGEVDQIDVFDRKGIIKSTSLDDDFNGTFETDVFYTNGNTLWIKSDTTGDGFKDYRADYQYGLAEKISFIDANTHKILKIQYFELMKLVRAEVDTNGDGVLDSLYQYDSNEEISKKQKI